MAEILYTDIKNDYLLGRKLGKPGAYGYARLAIHRKTGVRYAVKVVPKSKFKHRRDAVMFRREGFLLCQLSHPNIVKAHALYETKEDICIVEDLCVGGELFERLERKTQAGITYSEHDAAAIIRQVAQALAYLHSMSIAHLDIKPDNILFTSHNSQNQVKLVDFNLAKRCKSHRPLSRMVGTIYYVAPEVLRGCYTWTADVWSLGVIMFMLLFGFPPFDGPTDADIISQIKTGLRTETYPGRGPWPPKDIPVSAEALDLLSRLLTKQPNVRINAVSALKHPWLNGLAPGLPITPSVLCNLDAFLKSSTSSELVAAGKLHEHDTNCSFRPQTPALSVPFTAENASALMELFLLADQDGDGLVSLQDLEQALLQSSHLSNQTTARTQLRKVPAHLPVRSDSRINQVSRCRRLSYRDLEMAVIHDRALGNEERLRDLFSQVDEDGDLDAWLQKGDMARAISGFASDQEAKRLISSRLSSASTPGSEAASVHFDEFAALLGLRKCSVTDCSRIHEHPELVAAQTTKFRQPSKRDSNASQVPAPQFSARL